MTKGPYIIYLTPLINKDVNQSSQLRNIMLKVPKDKRDLIPMLRTKIYLFVSSFSGLYPTN
jgi:hypothetical protein